MSKATVDDVGRMVTALGQVLALHVGQLSAPCECCSEPYPCETAQILLDPNVTNSVTRIGDMFRNLHEGDPRPGLRLVPKWGGS